MSMTREDDVAIQLARLAPKAAQITGDAGGGHPAWLTPSDIAAACAGIPEPHGSLLLAKYVNDQQAAIKAIGGVTDMLLKAGCALNAQLLAVIVIELHITGPRCSRCCGRGQITRRTGVVVDCERCSGTGKLSAPSTEIARRARLKVEDYRKHCKSAVQAVQRNLESGEDDALNHVHAQIRRMSAAV